MAVFEKQDGRLVYRYDHETVVVEPWGRNSLRVRATMDGLPAEDWALLPAEAAEASIEIGGAGASITNGALRAELTNSGLLRMFNGKGEKILEEFSRHRRDVTSEKCSALEIEARDFKGIIGGDYKLAARFESLDENERIYGMGQYQQPHFNLKGADLELAQRNSQASVPFAVSSLGYGFLWNNPAVGRVVFGKNQTTWEAYSTKALDYWVTVADSPAEILQAYVRATGLPPMMPDYGMGFWQCKLRYSTQDELLAVAREYKRRGIPLSVIVIDFFHWPWLGDWRLDPVYWPDPAAMMAELKEMGVELMVSVWPYVHKQSENYTEMLEKGYLIRAERGERTSMDCGCSIMPFDATNPEARAYVWEKLRQNYGSLGIKAFWLDEAEPEYGVYDFENYRYHAGPNLQIGNKFPRDYTQMVCEGLQNEGDDKPMALVRCAWAGSQRYGALVWSGDIASSFASMRNQLTAGLQMAMSGIPWWTTDIGGFHGGDPREEWFRELFARWFAYGTFCPVMRLHGDREPRQPELEPAPNGGMASGGDNEVWSYGERVYDICVKYINLREGLRGYTTEVMAEAHEKGTPAMRPLLLAYPGDARAWDVTDAYLYGPDILVAPVTTAGATGREVYLPAGDEWVNAWTGEKLTGGQAVTVDAPLEIIPLFIRNGRADLMALFA